MSRSVPLCTCTTRQFSSAQLRQAQPGTHAPASRYHTPRWVRRVHTHAVGSACTCVFLVRSSCVRRASFGWRGSGRGSGAARANSSHCRQGRRRRPPNSSPSPPARAPSAAALESHSARDGRSSASDSTQCVCIRAYPARTRATRRLPTQHLGWTSWMRSAASPQSPRARRAACGWRSGGLRRASRPNTAVVAARSEERRGRSCRR